MPKSKNPISVAGGKARTGRLTATQRKKLAKKASAARWGKKRKAK